MKNQLSVDDDDDECALGERIGNIYFCSRETFRRGLSTSRLHNRHLYHPTCS